MGSVCLTGVNLWPGMSFGGSRKLPVAGIALSQSVSHTRHIGQKEVYVPIDFGSQFHGLFSSVLAVQILAVPCGVEWICF